jgi:hypothetical protein
MLGQRRVAEMTHTSVSALDNGGNAGRTMSVHAIYQIFLYSTMYGLCTIAEFVLPLSPYKQINTKK